MRLKCNYFAVIFLYSGWTNLVSSRNATTKSGPFKTVGLKVNNKCDNVIYPYEKEPSAYVDVELAKLPNGAEVVKTNLTVLRETRGLKMRLTGYIWENGKWNLVTSMNNIGCRGAIFPVLHGLSGLDMDVKRCYVRKGSYVLKDLNVDEIDHLLTKKREYGKMMWRVEVYNVHSATLLCTEYENAVLPAESTS